MICIGNDFHIKFISDFCKFRKFLLTIHIPKIRVVSWGQNPEPSPNHLPALPYSWPHILSQPHLAWTYLVYLNSGKLRKLQHQSAHSSSGKLPNHIHPCLNKPTWKECYLSSGYLSDLHNLQAFTLYPASIISRLLPYILIPALAADPCSGSWFLLGLLTPGSCFCFSTLDSCFRHLIPGP